MTRYGSPDVCRNNHPYTAENTVWERHANGRTYRRCRTCRQMSSTKHNRRRGKARAIAAQERHRQRRERDMRIRKLYAQGLMQVEVADQIGCSVEVVRAAVNPEYRESRRRWARELAARKRAEETPGQMKPATWRALRARHKAAMRIVDSLSANERWELLAAVVWPEDERLEGAA